MCNGEPDRGEAADSTKQSSVFGFSSGLDLAKVSYKLLVSGSNPLATTYF